MSSRFLLIPSKDDNEAGLPKARPELSLWITDNLYLRNLQSERKIFKRTNNCKDSSDFDDFWTDWIPTVQSISEKKIERPRCPEVGLGILDFVVRTVRASHKKHAKCIGFSCVFGTSRQTKRCRHIPRSTGQGLEALSESSPQKIYVFLAWF